jgi:putative copper export protein/methionine-rich copper-binding protein CopC
MNGRIEPAGTVICRNASSSPRWRRVKWAAFGAAMVIAPFVAAQSAAADVIGTEPAANTNSAPPKELSVSFSDAVDSTGSTVTVFSSDHKPVATGVFASDPANPTKLSFKLPDLKDGVYTAQWSVRSGKSAEGVFAFGVDAKGAAAKTVQSPKAVFKARPTNQVVIAWIPWLSVFVFTGALLLRFLVTAPAARRMPDRIDSARAFEATDRRLNRVAAIALLALVPSTLVQVAFQAGASKGYAFSKIGKLIAENGAGHLWGARLLFTALAALIVWTFAIRKPSKLLPKAMLVAAVLGVLEMAARVVPSGKPTNWPRTIFGDVMVFAHLVGGAVWIGGLVGLMAIAVKRGLPVSNRGPFWSTALPRFSAAAMSCVAAIVVSGLWLYWTHIASLSQLFGTLYGKSLVIKLAMVALLLALGAFNHIWLKPRVDAHGFVGQNGKIANLIDNHLRRVVAVEVLLGLGVLFMVPYLSGSARNQTFQKAAADISKTAAIAGSPVKLTPSGLQPGVVNYDVSIPDSTTHEVRLTFASNELKVPAQQAEAKSIGNGVYRATGIYTPMVGLWDIAVDVDGKADPAKFQFPVTAKAAALPRAPAPKITAVTWLYGLLDVAVVGFGLLLASRLSKKIAAAKRTKFAAEVAPPTASRSVGSWEEGQQLVVHDG